MGRLSKKGLDSNIVTKRYNGKLLKLKHCEDGSYLLVIYDDRGEEQGEINTSKLSDISDQYGITGWNYDGKKDIDKVILKDVITGLIKEGYLPEDIDIRKVRRILRRNEDKLPSPINLYRWEWPATSLAEVKDKIKQLLH